MVESKCTWSFFNVAFGKDCMNIRFNYGTRWEVQVGLEISVLNQDITKLDIEAIVCTTNTGLQEQPIGPSVATQINLAIDNKLNDDLSKISVHKPDIGDVFITDGHTLQADKIVTIVVNSPSSSIPGLSDIHRFVISAVRHAAEASIKAIAFPIICSGVIDLSPVDTGKKLIDWISECPSAQRLDEVRVCVLDESLKESLNDYLAELQSHSDTSRQRTAGPIAPVARAMSVIDSGYSKPSEHIGKLKARMEAFLTFNRAVLLAEYLQSGHEKARLDREIREIFTTHIHNSLGGKQLTCLKLAKYLKKRSTRGERSLAHYWTNRKGKYTESYKLLKKFIEMRNWEEHGPQTFSDGDIPKLNALFSEALQIFERHNHDLTLLRIVDILESRVNEAHNVVVQLLHDCSREYVTRRKEIRGNIIDGLVYLFCGELTDYEKLIDGLCLWPLMHCDASKGMDCLYYLDKVDFDKGLLEYSAWDIEATMFREISDRLPKIPPKLLKILK